MNMPGLFHLYRAAASHRTNGFTAYPLPAHLANNLPKDKASMGSTVGKVSDKYTLLDYFITILLLFVPGSDKGQYRTFSTIAMHGTVVDQLTNIALSPDSRVGR